MKITNEILNRKGAIKATLLSPDVIELLNAGLIESVNLTEWLAVDHSTLVKNVLPEAYRSDCLLALEGLTRASTMQSTVAIGKAIYDKSGGMDKQLFDMLSSHVSDSVRCWATYLVGLDTKLSIDKKLEAIQSFAADTHFGVREIAWMAVRQSISDNLDEAISILTGWTADRDANVRRFASESIRPRGVWCKHIDKLKEQPQIALPILEPLRSDPAKYVQDSVGNWLNDASKSLPDWVITLCDRWEKESQTKETKYIVKKALRSIKG